MYLKCFATYNPPHTDIYKDLLFEYEYLDNDKIRLFQKNWTCTIWQGRPYYWNFKVKPKYVKFVYKTLPNKFERKFCKEVKRRVHNVKAWCKSELPDIGKFIFVWTVRIVLWPITLYFLIKRKFRKFK